MSKVCMPPCAATIAWHRHPTDICRIKGDVFQNTKFNVNVLQNWPALPPNYNFIDHCAVARLFVMSLRIQDASRSILASGIFFHEDLVMQVNGERMCSKYWQPACPGTVCIG